MTVNAHRGSTVEERRSRRAGTESAIVLVVTMALLLSGCEGRQSALDPAGAEARELAGLFWMMTVSGGIIWTIFMAMLFYALWLRPHAHEQRTASRLVWIAGIAAPVVVLTTLLVYALPLMPALRQEASAFRIEVTGEQFWWRAQYRLPDGSSVTTANEIRMPVSEKIEIALTSPDVIHSFWVPSLAGKMDMIPGRVNRLVLRPERTGTYRGACAELCGTSHALMAFDVHVMEAPAFAAWLDQQKRRARSPETPEQQRGATLFIETGCGACHTIRGTAAAGTLGPDLTHVGSRTSLAAGQLPNNVGTMAGWIAGSQDLKPGNKMPLFNVLPGQDLRAVASYLTMLQ